jgi:membrane protease YdiL (CAAX protease family)
MTTLPRETAGAGFGRTVFLLLRAARRRATGRQKRQRELMQRRTGRKATFRVGWLGVAGALFLGVVLNVMAAFLVYSAVQAGERAQVEENGKIPVDAWFLRAVREAGPRAGSDSSLERFYSSEATSIAFEEGGSTIENENKLRAAVRAHGARDLVKSEGFTSGFTGLPRAGTVPAMMGSIVLFWWCVMIVFQGEGLELDLQRRRHPMWEWLFSHPVPSGAVFLAEMLSPLAANPIYCTAPLFTGMLYAFAYGPMPGLVAGVVAGIPIAIAAACLGKALEIGAILRFAPRTRGAVVGLMSWIGYASLMLFLIGTISLRKMIVPAAHFLHPLTVVPWPWLGLFLGQIHGSFSFLLGMITCWAVAGVTMAAAVAFSVWGARQGLSGNFGRAGMAPTVSTGSKIRFGKDPLYRKELLWFVRDRSAVVQTLLIPLTIGGFQLFNMRGLLGQAQGAWNYLCGAAILFGTYFLWILGPKSLASEGPALWIALTWPRGMESLLKAKAWLWALLSSGLVVLVLLYAGWRYPADAWKVALVGVAWLFFGRSMAEKSVTLVRAPSSSGEMERPSRGRQWAASLGMLTFAIGILTQQWHIAVMGIVYSYITAAAMWENFRARLPFLYDPWSEKIPPPPTLMHAMIAISILVESGAILTGIALAVVGRANIATAQVTLYGICAFVVSLCTWWFLSRRGVPAREVWCWRRADNSIAPREPWWCGDGSHGVAFLFALALGASSGVILGLFARGYLAVMLYFPAVADLIHKSQAQMNRIPGMHTSYAIIAVFLAPFAEEYLFRGLLFRALDREWGGWRAIAGSAAFFAIYHPLLSWLPVSLLGATNALIFKKTGRLAPAVVLHMVYNAVVVLG